ncbi:hypothetical protein N7444_001484 [Penicillium canescens]|nr:hypothetical protein N7444_001484 [Penicillium canescens]
MVIDRPFRLVHDDLIPDVACCEAMLDALRDLIGLLADDHPAKCPIKYKAVTGLTLREAALRLDEELSTYDYYAGPESIV